MKTNYTILFLVFFLCLGLANGQQKINNGPMEEWDEYFVNDPSGWFTGNREAVYHKMGFTVLEVPGVSGSAVELGTYSNGDETVFGFFNTSDGDPLEGEGGFPYSQQPDSITGYYKYSIEPGDTALLLVVFKKNGGVVSTDLFKIPGGTPQTTFKRFAYPLSLAVVPDSVIIAAASSNAISEIGIQSGSTITFDELAFAGAGITQPIPNGNFDTWAVTDTIYDPVDWDVIGEGIKRTTDSYKGNYAALLETKNYEGSGIMGSGITNGTVTMNGTEGGIPFTALTDTLVFYYKYIPSGTDTAYVFVSLTNNGIPVGGQIESLLPASSYTLFELPVVAGSFPDTLRIQFNSSSFGMNQGNAGSKLYIDEIQLKSDPQLTTSVKRINLAGDIKAYPNPATSEINIAFTADAAFNGQISILDISGKTISAQTVAIEHGQNLITLPTHTFSDGVYFYQLLNTQTGAISSGRFSKQ